MSGRTAKAEALKKKLDERKTLLTKHLEAGMAKDGDVVRRDRKLLKRATRQQRKLALGRKISKKQRKEMQ